jgi:thiol-disulfide isomerase/thioredoxin
MTPKTCALALLASAIFFVAAGHTQEKEIAMVPVKYVGLKQEVLKHRGKVLLVDFWGGFCVPCKQKMPHVIELQGKLADQGFVAITVSIDTPDNPASVKVANKFLNTIKSPLRNLLLDEPSEVWEKKLDLGSVPCYYVFDRRGKWVRFRAFDHPDTGIDFVGVEKTIMRMLAEK